MAEVFTATAHDRLEAARSAKSAGRKVIGVVGWGVPSELILAAGALPVRIFPDTLSATPTADALIGAGEPTEVRALFERGTDGTLAFLDLLIVAREHEWLYYYLKEATRLGIGDVPPIHLHDLIPSAEESVRAYNRQRVDGLIDVLGRTTGALVDHSAVARVLPRTNARRAALRELQQLRDAGKISGTDATHFIAASLTANADEFAEATPDWFASRTPPSGVRVLLLGNELAGSSALHEAIEAAGAIVVAEDGEWGSRSAQDDLIIAGDLSAAITNDLIAAANGPAVSPRHHRLGWAEAALARTDIDAVIFAVSSTDRSFGWNYPSLREFAAGLGLPQFLLREDAQREPDKVTSAVSAFLSTIDQGAAA